VRAREQLRSATTLARRASAADPAHLPQRDLLGAGWSQAVSGASHSGRAGMSRERCGSRVEEQRRLDPSPAKIPTALRSRRRGCPAAHDCSTWCGSPAPKCTTTTARRCCCRPPAPLSPSCFFLGGPSPTPPPPFPHLLHLDGWLGWRVSAWARRHVRASRRVQAKRDDAGFGVAAAERNDCVEFGVPRCSRKNGKSDLEVALPALSRPQCRQS
jgi:hypothetical protein